MTMGFIQLRKGGYFWTFQLFWFGPGCHFSRSEYTSRGELRQSWVAKNRLEVWKYLCFQYYD